MGIAYKIDKEIGALFAVYDGVVTDDDYVAHTERLLGDPDWPPENKLDLTDLTTLATPLQLTESSIKETAEMWRSRKDLLKGMRMAGVATEGFGHARLFESTITGYGPTMIVFNVLGTACTWLGIDEERAAQTLKALRAQARNASAK